MGQRLSQTDSLQDADEDGSGAALHSRGRDEINRKREMKYRQAAPDDYEAVRRFLSQTGWSIADAEKCYHFTFKVSRPL
jgi:hypothetical protein